MKDKVDEFRKILNQKKILDDQKKAQDAHYAEDSFEGDGFDDEATQESPAPSNDDQKNESGNSWQAKYEELKKASEIQRDQYLRQAAEFENSRKRLIKEQEDAIKFANERVFREIFPVLDNLEMTLSHVTPEQAEDPLIKGVQLTLKSFLQILEKNGLREVGAVGDAFDPHLHEAIGTEANPDIPSNHIAKVMRKGYTLNGRLIRAAMVTISQT
jgi:molecular chaperone GrpE